ncbi:MAG: S41 family peptidase [SAR202 cluster bacterium]|jgi:carboxyl-terminal processing protease|nr:peptidase S41 [Chloroflexota bacterium]MDP6425864.1 S41 family peptidase [Dehalococcoidia bacterium]MDP7612947.1 S41 family peptidase [Dehalococcoidia bacterium]MQG46662.1 S41 family peptidase [SAR202 cluster bacterium]
MFTDIRKIVASLTCLAISIVVLSLAFRSTSTAPETLPNLDLDKPDQQVTTIIVPDQVPRGLEIVWEAFSIINHDFIDKHLIDPAKMSETAVDAMVESLDNKHTSYIRPEAFSVQNEDFKGKFGGIGAQVSSAPDGKGVIITKPLPNTPAEKAGIKAGDRIIAVNGEDATDWSVLEAVNKIRGPEGTKVTITVEHVGSLDPIDITVVRGIIDQPSVFSRDIPETEYTKIRLTQFTAETPNEFRKELKSATSSGKKGIVLDLRGNPGGLLSATVEVASELLPQGIITYEIDATGNRTDWPTMSGGSYLEVPIVTLIDKYSASGAEVLVGALQDAGRSILIGETTFGKGSVNIVRGLSNGGGIYLTHGRWYTPNGRMIEEVGIEPDVVVSYPAGSKEDPQLKAAIDQLNFQNNNTK